ncbi:hypothetical protein ACJX0J_005554 [Zea mays]
MYVPAGASTRGRRGMYGEEKENIIDQHFASSLLVPTKFWHMNISIRPHLSSLQGPQFDHGLVLQIDENMNKYKNMVSTQEPSFIYHNIYKAIIASFRGKTTILSILFIMTA